MMAPLFSRGLCGLSEHKLIKAIFLKSKILTVIVETQVVEHPAAGLLPHVLVHQLAAQLVQTHRVGERLRAGLQREVGVHVAQRVSGHSTV